MELVRKPLRITLDDNLMVREASIHDTPLVATGQPVSLLTVQQQAPEMTAPQATYCCDDLSWRNGRASEGRRAYSGRADDGSLEIALELARDDRNLRTCQVTLTNRSACPITSIAFTPLTAVPLSAAKELELVIPHWAGCIVPASNLDQGQRILLTYPIQASMQWTDLVFEQAGIYLACHDREPFLKQLIIERGADHLAVYWRYTDLCVRQDERLVLPPFVIAGHDNGWVEAAAFYRTWARQWMREPQPPEWFARCPSWCWFALKPQHAPRPTRRYADVPDLARRTSPKGTPALQLCRWMKNGHDTNYPDFEAGEDMGGEEGLAAAFATIHNEQRRAGLYVNARVIDPDSHFARDDNWQAECVALAPCAREAAAIISCTFTAQSPRPELRSDRDQRTAEWDPEQKLAKEQYGRVVFGIGCPSSPKWRKYYVERIRHVVKTYHPDGIFLDQVCGAAALPCYSRGHEHDRPGLAWRGYLALLASLREIVRAECPESYLATEGVGDVFGQYIDAFQAHNDWTGRALPFGIEAPEVFRVTFPQRLLLIGTITRDQARYVRLGHLLGAGLDLAATAILEAERPFRLLLERVLTLRERLNPYIRGAEPYPHVASETPGLRVFGLQQQDASGAGTLLINGAWLPPDDAKPPPGEFQITAQLDHQIAEAVLHGESLEQTHLEPLPHRGRISLAIPGANVFSVLLRW